MYFLDLIIATDIGSKKTRDIATLRHAGSSLKENRVGST
jgi:hypothetical protein